MVKKKSTKASTGKKTGSKTKKKTANGQDAPVQYRALYSYEGQQEDELSFKRADVIEVVHKNTDEWWTGMLNGQVGLLPATYLAKMPSVKKKKISTQLVVPVTGSAGGGLADIISESDRHSGGEDIPMSEASVDIPSPLAQVQDSITGATLHPEVVALHSYKAQQRDELSFKKNAIITVLEQNTADWWTGKLKKSGKVGLFPSTFVQRLDAEEDETEAEEEKHDEISPSELSGPELEEPTRKINTLPRQKNAKRASLPSAMKAEKQSADADDDDEDEDEDVGFKITDDGDTGLKINKSKKKDDGSDSSSFGEVTDDEVQNFQQVEEEESDESDEVSEIDGFADDDITQEDSNSKMTQPSSAASSKRSTMVATDTLSDLLTSLENIANEDTSSSTPRSSKHIPALSTTQDPRKSREWDGIGSTKVSVRARSSTTADLSPRAVMHNNDPPPAASKQTTKSQAKAATVSSSASGKEKKPKKGENAKKGAKAATLSTAMTKLKGKENEIVVCSGCEQVVLDYEKNDSSLCYAFDMWYHRWCLMCCQCAEPFLDEKAKIEEGVDGYAYCSKCFKVAFPGCGRCGLQIKSKQKIVAGGRDWHKKCFTCEVCNKKLPTDKQFYADKDGKPYCELDYYRAQGLICNGCKNPIIGRKCINAGGMRFHKEHFKCRNCDKAMHGLPFHHKDGELYCTECNLILFE